MKLVSVLSFLLSIISVCRAQCGSPTDQTNPPFTTVEEIVNSVNNCNFPTNKFNSSCVSASCLQLASSGLCPYTSEQNLNQTALTSILSILNSCFQQQKTTAICDTPLANLPLPPMTISLSQALPNLPIGGQCSKVPNTGLINNVQNVSFAISPAQSYTSGPLNVVIDAPAITMTGQTQCSISTPLLPISFNLPAVSYSIYIGIAPTASIDFSNDQPNVQARADNVTVNMRVENFAPIDSPIKLPASLQNLFTDGITTLYKTMGNPTAVANFYATFIAYGIQATKGNCPSP